jgi:hypothetical protein
MARTGKSAKSAGSSVKMTHGAGAESAQSSRARRRYGAWMASVQKQTGMDRLREVIAGRPGAADDHRYYTTAPNDAVWGGPALNPVASAFRRKDTRIAVESRSSA